MGRFADCEAGLLAAVKHDAARLLENLLNDPEALLQLSQALPGEERFGHQPKMVLTLLGYITLSSRQYLCNPEKRNGCR